MPVNEETGDWSGAVYKVGKSSVTNSFSGNSYHQSKAGFQASKNWTGTLGSESAHTHSFSKAVTIGSGEYTRPNSISCLYLISY